MSQSHSLLPSLVLESSCTPSFVGQICDTELNLQIVGGWGNATLRNLISQKMWIGKLPKILVLSTLSEFLSYSCPLPFV